MKLNKYSIVLLVFLSTILLVITAYQLYRTKESHYPLTCRAWLTQVKDNISINVLLRFMFRDGYGTVSMNGHKIYQNGSTSVISRMVYFNFRQDGDFYLLTSKNIVKFPDDNVDEEWVGNYFPAFYLKKEKDLYINILNQGDNNIIFIDPIPLLVCKTVLFGQ